jgi:flagellar hook-length control protein FliK
LTLHTPVSASHWGQELGSQVQWLASQGAHTAELRLNPPDLGPLEVRISSDGVSSSVQFFATNNVVRDAVEAALPRLRELFVQQGLQLSGADVSGQAMAEQRSREQFGAGTQGQSSSRSYAVEQDDLGDGALAAPVSSPGRIGLVDYYA